MSTAFDQASLAHSMGSQVLLTLLKLDSSELTTPIRVVHNRENITHNSNIYLAFPFFLSKPTMVPNELPKAKLTICNVDKRIAIAIREVSEALDATIKSVLASSPNTIEDGPYELKLRDVGGSNLVITGYLTTEDHSSVMYPADLLDPINAPGIF